MTDKDTEEWAHHGWAKQPSHSRVHHLAPADEATLTIMCGKRVLARVWPRGVADKLFIVTTRGMFPLLSRRWTGEVAPCACRRRTHVIDRPKLLRLLEEYDGVPPSRQPKVSVSRVGRD